MHLRCAAERIIGAHANRILWHELTVTRVTKRPHRPLPADAAKEVCGRALSSLTAMIISCIYGDRIVY